MDAPEYIHSLVREGLAVLRSRIPSGSPLVYDQVDAVAYHKWALNCISLLKIDAPDHVEQIKLIYSPDYSFYDQAEKIYGIVLSAFDFVKERGTASARVVGMKKSPSDFNLTFLRPRLIEKCQDHFIAGKYDDCIMNAAKVIEVVVRESAGLLDTDVGVNLMRKAFRPEKPLLRYSEIDAEQEAVMHMFSGFIGVFKNPHSHRFLEVRDPLGTYEVLGFADHMLGVIENLKLESE